MFEGCGNAELLDLMGDAQQGERAAFAHQLMAIGRYTVNRIDEQTDEHNFWVVDGWEQIAAEISAELGISRQRASSQMHYGQTLIERFPRLGAVFVAGLVDFRVIAAAIFRTDLIHDPEVLAGIDEQLAAKAPAWNTLSRERICELVDWMVIDADPEAVRIAKQRDLDRHIEVRPSQNGTAEIYGEVRGPDGAVFDAALDELAATVCPDDPRTTTQRRTDALRPLAARAMSMPCLCGCPDCPAAGTEASSTAVVINVIAEAATLDGSSDKPGYLPGYGAVPAATVAQMATTASLRPVPTAKDLGAEPNYRPSAALTRFVQCRDLTCSFPGCDQPAISCDIDHSVPYPYGPTHPSNNSLKCRIHHLLKTFCGWTDSQLPDGTIVWTSPSKRTYTTKPVGAQFFPQLATPTGALQLPNNPPPEPNRDLAMPKRKHTRTHDRTRRIEYERAYNRARYAADPPPF
ncbi:HNH endonuclease signature motif containing protein [Mycobacterium sp. JS623]|uniref:HNH endonuclease signature motif containing protein n=1 Tax=Mycobacterium sp. JS623 TaxID=212767 RepID=UPI000319440C|nr:HNH endonuclease signature motif containing protein [Mycobacterium sp. JS623]